MAVMLMTAQMLSRPAFGQTVYTPAEVARVLRVSEESIRREIRRGILNAARVGSQYRVTSNDLSTWLGATHYRDLFNPLGAISELIGTGTLEEDEATRVAIEIIAKTRATQPTPIPTGRTAPSPDEMRKRRENRIKAEHQIKHS